MTSSNRSAPLCAQPPPHCNTRIVMAPRPGPGCAASQTLFHPHRERLCELIRRSILFHPKRFCACIPMIYSDTWRVRRLWFQARRSAPTSAEANGVCSTGAAHAAPARLPNDLRFTGAAKRSGAASGAGAGWARARAGYSEYTDTSTWRVAWRRPRRFSSIVLSTFAA